MDTKAAWNILPGVTLALLLNAAGLVAAPAPAETGPTPAQKANRPAPVLEPRAVKVLQESGARLAAARSLGFTALASYEVPSRYGPPLLYGTAFDVSLQRPDKLRVISLGDGPSTEFYYDGTEMVSYHPAENLVAIAEAPPTIDAMLKQLYTVAGTYFPFTDVVVADPYGDIASGLQGAFSVGQSRLVGGVATDVVAYEFQGVFVQMWVGVDDKLPRLARAVYFDDPLQLRHAVQFSNWQVNLNPLPGTFSADKARRANPIAFGDPRLKSASAPAASGAQGKSE